MRPTEVLARVHTWSSVLPEEARFCWCSRCCKRPNDPRAQTNRREATGECSMLEVFVGGGVLHTLPFCLWLFRSSITRHIHFRATVGGAALGLQRFAGHECARCVHRPAFVHVHPFSPRPQWHAAFKLEDGFLQVHEFHGWVDRFGGHQTVTNVGQLDNQSPHIVLEICRRSPCRVLPVCLACRWMSGSPPAELSDIEEIHAARSQSKSPELASADELEQRRIHIRDRHRAQPEEGILVVQHDRRPRGRPRKVVQEKAVAESSTNTFQTRLVEFLRQVDPADCWKRLYTLAKRTGGFEEVRNVQPIFNLVLGTIPRRCQPLGCEAASVGIPRGVLKQQIIDSAAMVERTALMHLGSLFAHLLQRVESGDFTPLAAFTYMLYDETPLPASVREAGMGLWSEDDGTSKRSRTGTLQRELIKLVQLELHLIILAQCKERTLAFVFPVPCRLYSVDTATGETIFAVTSDLVTSIPLWSKIHERFFTMGVTTADRAGSNVRSELGWRFLSPADPRLRIACHVHILSTIQGRAFDVVGSMISGIIALALAQKAGGSLARFRRAMVKVLIDSVRIVHGVPPSPDTDEWQHRKAVLDASLDQSLADRKRRILLESDMNGDWTSDRFLWYTLPERSDLKQWAERVCKALLPACLPVFPRGRFISTDHILRQVVLLSFCHNLLKRVVLEWLGSSSQDAYEPCRLWTLEDTDVLSGHEYTPSSATALVQWLPVVNAGPVAPSQFWTAFNTRQRSDSIKFVQGPHKVELSLMLVTLAPQTKFMQRLLYLSSERFDREEAAKCARGIQRDYRLCLAATGDLTRPFWDDAQRMFAGPDLFGMLQSDENRTLRTRSMGLAMALRAAGGVYYHFDLQHRGYPWKLFRLVRFV